MEIGFEVTFCVCVGFLTCCVVVVTEPVAPFVGFFVTWLVELILVPPLEDTVVGRFGIVVLYT